MAEVPYPTRFHADHLRTFYIILYTDKQTDKNTGTDVITLPPCGDNKHCIKTQQNVWPAVTAKKLPKMAEVISKLTD